MKKAALCWLIAALIIVAILFNNLVVMGQEGEKHPYYPYLLNGFVVHDLGQEYIDFEIAIPLTGDNGTVMFHYQPGLVWWLPSYEGQEEPPIVTEMMAQMRLENLCRNEYPSPPIGQRLFEAMGGVQCEWYQYDGQQYPPLAPYSDVGDPPLPSSDLPEYWVWDLSNNLYSGQQQIGIEGYVNGKDFGFNVQWADGWGWLQMNYPKNMSQEEMLRVDNLASIAIDCLGTIEADVDSECLDGAEWDYPLGNRLNEFIDWLLSQAEGPRYFSYQPVVAGGK